MTFGAAIKTCFRKAFNDSDRATRSEYWWFAAFCFAVSFFGFSLLFEFLPEPQPKATGLSVALLVFFGLILFLFVATAAIVLYLALVNAGERRLNDVSVPAVRVQRRRLSDRQRRMMSIYDTKTRAAACVIAAILIMGWFPVLSASFGKDIDAVFPLKVLASLLVLPAIFLTPLGWIMIPGYVPFYFLAKRSFEHENKFGPNPNEVST